MNAIQKRLDIETMARFRKLIGLIYPLFFPPQSVIDAAKRLRAEEERETRERIVSLK